MPKCVPKGLCAPFGGDCHKCGRITWFFVLITPEGPLVLLEDPSGAIPALQHADRVSADHKFIGLDAICSHCMELVEFSLAIPDDAWATPIA